MHAGIGYVPDGELSPCFPVSFCDPVAGASKVGEELLYATLQAMDRHNIVLAFLSDSQESVDAWYAAAPDRFMRSVLFLNPSTADFDMIQEIYKSGELKGMGELATQYAGFAANNPRLDPLFALAEKYDLPILIHSDGTAGHSNEFRVANEHPELLQDVLLRHPALRVWVENAGFPFLDEMIALMYRFPNVYADLSTITWVIPRSMFYRHLRGLIDAGLGERLMFGSDQMQWPEAVDEAYDAINSADFLTAQQKRDIFYNNAARFLRLSEEEIAKHHGN